MSRNYLVKYTTDHPKMVDHVIVREEKVEGVDSEDEARDALIRYLYWESIGDKSAGLESRLLYEIVSIEEIEKC